MAASPGPMASRQMGQSPTSSSGRTSWARSTPRPALWALRLLRWRRGDAQGRGRGRGLLRQEPQQRRVGAQRLAQAKRITQMGLVDLGLAQGRDATTELRDDVPDKGANNKGAPPGHLLDLMLIRT